MYESDPFSLGADTRLLVDQPESGFPAAVESGRQVVDGKTDVMNPGSAFRYELPDGRVRRLGFEKLHERVTSLQAGDSGAVGVIERVYGQLQHVTIKRKDAVE